MADLVLPTDTKAALYTVCLFLAQSGEPHTELGYETRIAAFDDIGTKFGVPKNTVRNIRDIFDRFTDSDRVGWENSALPERFQIIFDQVAGLTREELRNLSQGILASEWEKLGSEGIENEVDKQSLVEAVLMAETSHILPDLQMCQHLSRQRISKIPIEQMFAPAPEVWEQIIALYKDEAPTDKVTVIARMAMSIETGKDKMLTISSQELPRCWAVRPYVLGILKYEAKVDELARALGFPNRNSGRGREEVFKKLPSATWEADLTAPDVSAIKDAIQNGLSLNVEEQERFMRFLSDGKWSGVSKTLERSDWPISAIVSAGGWLANASTRRGELSVALAKSPVFNDLKQFVGPDGQAASLPISEVSVPALKGGENVIFYGAPGTGKSNKVEEEIKGAGKRPFRTVFHPDLQNSDFFGCLKPKMDGKDVIYGFSPGPFMQALAEAYKTPSEQVFLVVEELNRAAAAAVFGDLFLLLDRDDVGHSVYDVDFPSTESKEWFERNTGAAHEKLRLPSNLFIYATMNSADQGVYPIDTAFRRRWRQEYLPLDYKHAPVGDVGYIDATGKHRLMAWRDFVRLLNEYLTKDTTLNIAEDRLLGQWFVKANELDGTGIPDKVLLYLWDDLLRHEGRPYVFDAADGGKVRTYGGLVLEAKEGRRFFSDTFLAVLNAASDVDDDEAAEPDNDAG